MALSSSSSSPGLSSSEPSSPGPLISAPRLYAILYPLTHPSFRIPVLKSVAQQHSIPLAFYPLPADDAQPWDYQSIVDSHNPTYDPEDDVYRPFNIVALPDDDAAHILLRTCTVIRRIVHLWAAGTASRKATRTALQHPSSDALVTPWKSGRLSWKAEILTLGAKVSQDVKRRIIEQTDFMQLKGPVDLANPQFEWAWYEESWSISGTGLKEGHRADMVHRIRLVVVGRRIQLHQYTDHTPAHPGMARDWIDRLDLKKRSYIGNTSMEAEMSLNMAQMAQSGPGKLVYDPFVGTGSLVVAAAALGAYIMGSDIDGRMMRGKGVAKHDPSVDPGIIKSARQYGIQGRFLDFCTFDITQHPWRMLHGNAQAQTTGPKATAGLLDAIIADPPYGVRAGAKRLGNRDLRKQRDGPFWLQDRQAWSHEQEDYVPPTRPYALCDLLRDLLIFSAEMLKDDGRLVFWMPVISDEADAERRDSKRTEPRPSKSTSRSLPTPAPTTPVPDGPEWKQVAVSTQDFGKWSRRLVTLCRIPRDQCKSSRDHASKVEVRSCSVQQAAHRPSSPFSSGRLQQTDHAGNADFDSAAVTLAQRAKISDSRTQFHVESGRFRANVDRRDFRNQYFRSQG